MLSAAASASTLSSGAIVGIVLAAVALLASLVAAVAFVIVRKRRSPSTAPAAVVVDENLADVPEWHDDQPKVVSLPLTPQPTPASGTYVRVCERQCTRTLTRAHA